MTDPRHIKAVARAALKAALAGEELDAAIRKAHAGGASLRAIAAAANLSHEQVRRIINRH